MWFLLLTCAAASPRKPELPEEDKDFHDKFEQNLADERREEDKFDAQFRHSLGVLPGQKVDRNLPGEIGQDTAKLKADQKEFEDKFDAIAGFSGLAAESTRDLKHTSEPLRAELPARTDQQKRLQRLDQELREVHKFAEKKSLGFTQSLRNLADASSFAETGAKPLTYEQQYEAAEAKAQEYEKEAIAIPDPFEADEADQQAKPKAKFGAGLDMFGKHASTQAEIDASNRRLKLAFDGRPPQLTPVMDVVQTLDKQCMMARCKPSLSACDDAEGDCSKRLACFEKQAFGFAFPIDSLTPGDYKSKEDSQRVNYNDDKIAQGTRELNCWSGMMWSELHPHEKAMFGCAKDTGCFLSELPSESSFVQVAATERVDAFSKGLADLDALKSRFTSNRDQLHEIEAEQKDAWAQAFPSSFLETGDGPDYAETKDEEDRRLEIEGTKQNLDTYITAPGKDAAGEGIANLQEALNNLGSRMRADASGLESGLKQDEDTENQEYPGLSSQDDDASSLLETSDANRAAAALNARMFAVTQRKLQKLKALVKQSDELSMQQGVLKLMLALHPEAPGPSPGAVPEALGHPDYKKLVADLEHMHANMKQHAAELHQLAHETPAGSLAEIRPLLQDTASSVERVFGAVDMGCALNACEENVQECTEDPRYENGDCHHRLKCASLALHHQDKQGMQECYAGLRWSEMTPRETQLVDCSIKAGCLKKGWDDRRMPSSLLEPSRGQEALRDVLDREKRNLERRAPPPAAAVDDGKYIPDQPSSFLQNDVGAGLQADLYQLENPDFQDGLEDKAIERDGELQQEAIKDYTGDERDAEEDERASAKDMDALGGQIGKLKTEMYDIFDPKGRPAPAFNPDIVPANQHETSLAEVAAKAQKWDSSPDYATYKAQVENLEKQQSARSQKTKQVLDNLSASIQGLTEEPVATLAFERRGLPAPADYDRHALGLAETDPDESLFRTQEDHLHEEEDELDALPKPRELGDPLPDGVFDQGTTMLKTYADVPVDDLLKPSYLEVDSQANIGQLRRAQ